MSSAVNPKKAEKAATWLTRGKVYNDAAVEISKNIYRTMPVVAADIMFGKSASQEQVVVNGTTYIRHTYPAMIVYADQGGMIQAWEIQDAVHDNALEEAAAAFDKAYELDADKKNAEKINEGFHSIFTEYYKLGSNAYTLGKFDEAANDFERALKVTEYPGYTLVDAETVKSLVYNAGLAHYFAGNYDTAINYFNRSADLGYELDGEVYYLLYHAYRQKAGGNNEVLAQVEPVLERGFSIYPDNAKVIEAMTDLYVVLGKDTKELVPIVELAIENDSENPSLWNGLARLYDSLGNYDRSIEAFEHVAGLIPDNFGAHYSQGVLYVKKADAAMVDVNAREYANQAEYDAAKAGTLEIYRQAVAPLERAHTIAPRDITTLELLRNIIFRLRDEAGMQAKLDKYSALLNELKN